MSADMAVELRKENVACVSLWPGAVMTENVGEMLSEPMDEKVRVTFTLFCGQYSSSSSNFNNHSS